MQFLPTTLSELFTIMQVIIVPVSIFLLYLTIKEANIFRGKIDLKNLKFEFHFDMGDKPEEKEDKPTEKTEDKPTDNVE